MLRIFKVEVSTNGRSHLLVTDDKVDIKVTNKEELHKKRKELQSKYEEEFKLKDLTIYLSYVEEG